jgi:dipeptidyl aminopeptidase/acylaminoacyl peptidase
MSQTQVKQQKPFGLWPSPVSTALVSTRTNLQDVQWNSDGKTLVWHQAYSGKGTLYAKEIGNARQALTDEQNVRAGVGYGGGDFSVYQDYVLFSERDGRLYQRRLGFSTSKAIIPPFGSCASPVASPDARWAAYVHSDGKDDVIALVDINGARWPQQFAAGADFYMQPAWHPSGKQLAWIEWDHPNMPWDGTRLVLAQLDGDPPRIVQQKVIAGKEDLPVAQPLFSPDGRWLSYVACSGEWEKLVLLDLQSGEEQTLVDGVGFTLAQPAWVQGIRNYGWGHDSQSIFYSRFQNGITSLWHARILDNSSTQIDTGPYTWIPQLSVSPVSDQIAFLASAPDIPNRIVHWDGKDLQIVARSESETLSPEYFSQPETLTWSAPDGMHVYGLFYPPQNPGYTCDGLPPAIINIHGGPTSSVPVRYNAEIAYYTSRGYAYLEVNYRGSTGFGRSYQLAQRLCWGKVDVEDAVGAANLLESKGLADGKRLVISGGSAGGYTVLNALVQHPGRFKAGICRYGVSNLFSLAMDTHKFESHYNDSLVGPLPEAAGRCHDWSPIFHADRIQDPLAVFQGSEDNVVPPDQSESIVRALAARGVPHIYRLYDGEGHGFRKSENIADYLHQTERFMQQYVLFSP